MQIVNCKLQICSMTNSPCSLTCSLSGARASAISSGFISFCSVFNRISRTLQLFQVFTSNAGRFACGWLVAIFRTGADTNRQILKLTLPRELPLKFNTLIIMFLKPVEPACVRVCVLYLFFLHLKTKFFF